MSQSEHLHGGTAWRTLGYGLLLAAAVGGFLLVERAGNSLQAPEPHGTV